MLLDGAGMVWLGGEDGLLGYGRDVGGLLDCWWYHWGLVLLCFQVLRLGFDTDQVGDETGEYRHGEGCFG